MRRTFLICLAAVGILSYDISASEPEGREFMSAYIWLNRPLLVFAPAPGHPLLAAQREALAGQEDGLRDRDMVWIEVAGDTVTVDGRPDGSISADTLRRRYGVRRDQPAVLLVGKDGGVKMRQERPFTTRDLFDTIDAMPMRRQEMGTGTTD